ncbi:MAG: N-glycosylase/DNA lyase [Halanaerobiales bacterium]
MLREIYDENKSEIKSRLRDFKDSWFTNDEDIFTEMAFCVFTPQSKAHAGWNAATQLRDSELLFTGSADEIGPILSSNGVRFHKNKTRYLLENREKFYPNTKIKLMDYLNDNIITARENLKRDVKGWGYKEASHFLRNIGFGDEIAILDRHILRTLIGEGVIKEMPSNLGRDYLLVEKKMLNYCHEVGIEPDAMDLVMWYNVNGEFFK